MQRRMVTRAFFLIVLQVPTIGLAQQLTVTLEPVPGQVITGGGLVTIEAFIRNNGPDIAIAAYQLDLPCDISAPSGSTGMITTACTTSADCAGMSPTTCTSGRCQGFARIRDFSDPASGSVPWVFPVDDQIICDKCRLWTPATCRIVGSTYVGHPPHLLQSGGRWYLGTIRWRASQCAAGTFQIPLENHVVPCQNTDITRLVDGSGTCVNADFAPLTLSVSGACDDGLFCNGVEGCEPGIGCVSGTPPCGPEQECHEPTDTCRPTVVPALSAMSAILGALSLMVGGAFVLARRSARSIAPRPDTPREPEP